MPHVRQPQIASRTRGPRRGESVLDFLGGLIVLAVIGGGLWWFATGKNPLDEGQKFLDSQRLLGKWKQQDGPLTLEFFANGTLREGRLLNSGKGTYQLLPNRRMRLKIEGVMWGHNEATVRYDLSGNELVLTPDAGTGLALSYRKVH